MNSPGTPWHLGPRCILLQPSQPYHVVIKIQQACPDPHEPHTLPACPSPVQANYIAREMVYHSGFGARMGPIALQDDDENFLLREKWV